MEPVTILAITNASVGIARSLVLIVKELYEIAEAYETAATGIRTIAAQCNAFQVAVERIRKWLEKQDETSRHDLDEDFWQALKDNLDTGTLVIRDIETRIKTLKKTPGKFWTRTKYLWNHAVISELQSQIQALMSALSILIHVIDLPSIGAKRAQSRASSKRLNGLTVSVRNRVARCHDQTTIQAASSFDDSKGSPPPYEDAAQRLQHLSIDEKQVSPAAGVDQGVELRQGFTSPQRADDPAEPLTTVKSNESEVTKSRKKKRFWEGFRRTSSKDDKSSGPLSSQPHEQEAQSGVNHYSPVLSPHETSTECAPSMGENIESPRIVSESVHDVSNLDQGNVTRDQSKIWPIDTQPACRSNNPYRPPSPENTTSPERRRPDFSTGRTISSEHFDRIRPFHRVKDGQGASPNQTPTLSAQQSSLSSTSHEENDQSFSTAGDSQQGIRKQEQTWKTTAVTNRSLRVRVQIEKLSFTNKLSAAAAQALGATNTMVDYAGNPTTILTLLSTVSDGFSDEPNTVIGDEVEFVVMPEHEARGPVMILGQAFAHLAELTQAGEYVYWHVGPVPERLRTVDRLRLYNRFELVRW